MTDEHRSRIGIGCIEFDCVSRGDVGHNQGTRIRNKRQAR